MTVSVQLTEAVAGLNAAAVAALALTEKFSYVVPSYASASAFLAAGPVTESVETIMIGGVYYKRRLADPGNVAKIQNQGVWFAVDEIDLNPFTLDQFGAPSDPVDFTDMSGPDHTAALNALVEACAETGRVGVLNGRYRWSMPPVIPDNVRLIGLGAHRSGILIETDNTQGGIRIGGSNNHLGGMEIMGWLQQAKNDGNSGHIGVPVLMGDYLNGGLSPVIRDASFDSLKITRSPGTGGTPSFQTIAMMAAGDVSQVDIGDVLVDGNFSIGFQGHWTGNVSAVGEAITQSRHPQNINIGRLACINGVGTGVTLASCADVTVHKMMLKGSDKAIRILPGDEVDDFAPADQKGRIGRGLNFVAVYAEDCQEGNAGGDDVIDVASVGASKFRTEEGIVYKRTLDLGVHIGSAYLETSSATGEFNAVRCFEVTGSVKIDHLDAKGFDRSAQVVRSTGLIDINIGYADSKAVIDRSARTIIRGGNIHMSEIQHVDAYCIDASGTNSPSNLDGAVVAGNTSITLDAAFGHDVMPGDPIRVGTETVFATQFAEQGRLAIPVTEFVGDHADNSDVRLNLYSVVKAEANTVGGRGIARAAGAYVTILPSHPRQPGRYGYLAESGGDIEIHDAAPWGMSLVKAPSGQPAWTTYGVVANGGGHVRVFGGFWGQGFDDVTSLFDANVDGADVGTISVHGARIIDTQTLATVTAGANFSLHGCTDDEGGALTYP